MNKIKSVRAKQTQTSPKKISFLTLSTIPFIAAAVSFIIFWTCLILQHKDEGIFTNPGEIDTKLYYMATFMVLFLLGAFLFFVQYFSISYKYKLDLLNKKTDSNLIEKLSKVLFIQKYLPLIICSVLYLISILFWGTEHIDFLFICGMTVIVCSLWSLCYYLYKGVSDKVFREKWLKIAPVLFFTIGEIILSAVSVGVIFSFFFDDLNNFKEYGVITVSLYFSFIGMAFVTEENLIKGKPISDYFVISGIIVGSFFVLLGLIFSNPKGALKSYKLPFIGMGVREEVIFYGFNENKDKIPQNFVSTKKTGSMFFTKPLYVHQQLGKSYFLSLQEENEIYEINKQYLFKYIKKRNNSPKEHSVKSDKNQKKKKATNVLHNAKQAEVHKTTSKNIKAKSVQKQSDIPKVSKK